MLKTAEKILLILLLALFVPEAAFARDFVLAIDASGSMRREDHDPKVLRRGAAVLFVYAALKAQKNNRMALFTFHKPGIYGNLEGLSGNYNELIDKTAEIKNHRGDKWTGDYYYTDILGAYFAAYGLLKDSKKNDAEIWFLTDGIYDMNWDRDFYCERNNRASRCRGKEAYIEQIKYLTRKTNEKGITKNVVFLNSLSSDDYDNYHYKNFLKENVTGEEGNFVDASAGDISASLAKSKLFSVLADGDKNAFFGGYYGMKRKYGCEYAGSDLIIGPDHCEPGSGRTDYRFFISEDPEVARCELVPLKKEIKVYQGDSSDIPIKLNENLPEGIKIKKAKVEFKGPAGYKETVILSKRGSTWEGRLTAEQLRKSDGDLVGRPIYTLEKKDGTTALKKGNERIYVKKIPSGNYRIEFKGLKNKEMLIFSGKPDAVKKNSRSLRIGWVENSSMWIYPKRDVEFTLFHESGTKAGKEYFYIDKPNNQKINVSSVNGTTFDLFFKIPKLPPKDYIYNLRAKPSGLESVALILNIKINKPKIKIGFK